MASSRSSLLSLAALLLVGCGGPRQGAAAPLFTDEERAAVVRYWSAPGRYVVEPSPDVYLTWQGRDWADAARKRLADPTLVDDWLKERKAYEIVLLNGKPGETPPTPAPPPAAWGKPPASLYARERVNITVPGSTWHWNYARLPEEKRRVADTAAWEAWIVRRVAHDKGAAGGGPETPAPGPIPDTLREALGEPPTLFARVRPTRYTVTFAPSDADAPFIYTDTIPFPDRYAYYRSANGVLRYGKALREYAGDEKKTLDALFARVGGGTGNPFESNVLRAVSRLEGGFEAVNTYDTGFVSVGFIQCISARDGDGSLAAVLQTLRENDPRDYEATFRRFGLDVSPEGVIAAVDPASGRELIGAEAVQTIIDDKRLTAVFERAGYREGFQLAQVQVARARYWPGTDIITVPFTVAYEQPGGETTPKRLAVVWGAADTEAQAQAALARQTERQKQDPAYRSWTETQTLAAPVAEIIRSEAGMATLMDRKVNRGNIRAISEVAATLMREHKLTRIDSLRYYERDIIQAMKHRADFLADKTLTQPE